ncbi:MAG: hypothetical protein ABIS67_05665 [Candidatus Eisenbacteria bacterium]
MKDPIAINRAPVLTLWAAVVAERLGFDRDEALTIGRAVAGLNAQAKGQRLGVFTAPRPDEAVKRARKPKAKTAEHVELLGRSVAVLHTPHGLRAAKDGEPDSPEAVERYLESKFGESLEAAREAMAKLARSFSTDQLGEQAFSLYEAFRPEIPAGVRGWGAKGVLDLAKVAALAGGRKSRR